MDSNNKKVGNAILTPAAIVRIEELQTKNNSMIESVNDVVCNTLCELIKISTDENNPDIITLAREIVYIRDTINELKKPE